MITHDHKLIFIHIPKCAGRSVCEVFNQRFDHFTAAHYQKEYPKQWAEYEKFTIVRNPYARLVSMYHYITNHRRHKYEPIGMPGPRPVDFKTWVMENLTANKGPFDPSSPEAQRGTDGDLGSPFWFSPQCFFLGYNFITANPEIKIFKLENGIEGIEAWLSMKTGNEVVLKKTNTSDHKPWREYYDDELIEFLYDKPFIEADLQTFGYERLTVKLPNKPNDTGNRPYDMTNAKRRGDFEKGMKEMGSLQYVVNSAPPVPRVYTTCSGLSIDLLSIKSIREVQNGYKVWAYCVGNEDVACYEILESKNEKTVEVCLNGIRDAWNAALIAYDSGIIAEDHALAEPKEAKLFMESVPPPTVAGPSYVYTTCNGAVIDLLGIESTFHVKEGMYEIYMKNGSGYAITQEESATLVDDYIKLLKAWEEAKQAQSHKKEQRIVDISTGEDKTVVTFDFIDGIIKGIKTIRNGKEIIEWLPKQEPAQNADNLTVPWRYTVSSNKVIDLLNVKEIYTTDKGYDIYMNDGSQYSAAKDPAEILRLWAMALCDQEGTLIEENRVIRNTRIAKTILTSGRTKYTQGKLIRIRYNTEAREGDPLIWRVCREDWTEELAASVDIQCPTFTTVDILPDGRKKAHISMYCAGIQRKNNKVTIM